jgi:hypothetical protein
MNTRKAFITLGLVLTSLVMLPVAHADEWDQASKLTFSQSVQIPGRILPAGTYWFVLADSVGNFNIVQVFDSDRSTLYATILAIEAERLEPTEHTSITFAEQELMPTNAIVTWFYPGFNIGHEFVYSRSEGRELARAKQQTVIAMEPSKQRSEAGAD